MKKKKDQYSIYVVVIEYWWMALKREFLYIFLNGIYRITPDAKHIYSIFYFNGAFLEIGVSGLDSKLMILVICWRSLKILGILSKTPHDYWISAENSHRKRQQSCLKLEATSISQLSREPGQWKSDLEESQTRIAAFCTEKKDGKWREWFSSANSELPTGLVLLIRVLKWALEICCNIERKTLLHISGIRMHHKAIRKSGLWLAIVKNWTNQETEYCKCSQIVFDMWCV